MVSSIPIQCKKFLNSSILPIDGILTGTIIPRQSGPESNGNKEFEKKANQDTPLVGIFSLCKGFSQYILKPADRAL